MPLGVVVVVCKEDEAKDTLVSAVVECEFEEESASFDNGILSAVVVLGGLVVVTASSFSTPVASWGGAEVVAVT